MAMRRVGLGKLGGGRRGVSKVPSKVPPGMGRAPDAAAREAAAKTGVELVNEVLQREDAALANTYAIAVALMELAKPQRYRDELKLASFEELLEKKGMSSRMTAHKHVTVVSVFSEKEVRWIGGMEKSYLLIRWVRRRDAGADPREVLKPGAQVLGKLVPELSVRDLREALRTLAAGDAARTPATVAATKRGAARLRGAFRRVRIAAAVRAHLQDDQPHVSARFAAAAAVRLAEVLAAGKAGST
jgi:hypothetical protein